MQYTIIRLPDFRKTKEGILKQGILVQPHPEYQTVWNISDKVLNTFNRMARTDCEYQDSYVIFWLPERATDAQLDSVRAELDKEVAFSSAIAPIAPNTPPEL